MHDEPAIERLPGMAQDCSVTNHPLGRGLRLSLKAPPWCADGRTHLGVELY